MGGRLHATINWSTAEELIEADGPVISSIHDAPPAAYVDALTRAFPDFRAAMALDGLAVDEFEGFGPVQYFRDAFVSGWRQVLATMRDRRQGATVRIGAAALPGR